jgi:hypothetical protein
VAQVYRHLDGYPESILLSLDHLQDLLNATGAQRDASYAAAQFLLVDKLWRIRRTFRSHDGLYEEYPASIAEVLDVESWQEISKTPPYLLGHGIEDPARSIHGDEEYLYEIELPPRDPTDKPAEWSVKISEHCGFPRWDEEGLQQAFEVADWQFNGPLSEALAEVYQQ